MTFIKTLDYKTRFGTSNFELDMPLPKAEKNRILV